jgi:hypothetical protein
VTVQRNPPGIKAIKKRVSEIRLNLEMFVADYSGGDLSEISRGLQLTLDTIEDEIEARYEAFGHDV